MKSLDESEVLFESTAMPIDTNAYVDLTFATPRTLDGITIFIEGTGYAGIGEVELTAYRANMSINIDLEEAASIQGVTIKNGATPIETFEWMVSPNGTDWVSLGTFETPEESRSVGSEFSMDLLETDFTTKA